MKSVFSLELVERYQLATKATDYTSWKVYDADGNDVTDVAESVRDERIVSNHHGSMDVRDFLVSSVLLISSSVSVAWERNYEQYIQYASLNVHQNSMCFNAVLMHNK